MVTEGQKQEIEKRMRRIKKARNDGKSKEVILRRTNELVRYLDEQGIRNIYTDE